ncbi:MAG: prefoldin subunit [Candidatus Diapherotrites archaeon]|nr:prefoldin subunit [Candidatus Diapherotrites archaeon]
MAEKAEKSPEPREETGTPESKIVEFERNRIQLLNASGQRQQLQMQSAAMEQALEELEKTKEKKVYKAVGNILILSETGKVKKELKEKKEGNDLRVKTLQKQEESLVNKLNKLKADLEKAAVKK